MSDQQHPPRQPADLDRTLADHLSKRPGQWQGDPVGEALRHAMATTREKVEELSLVREISECATLLENPEVLARNLCRIVQAALYLDCCSLHALEEGQWRSYASQWSTGSTPDGPPDVTDELLIRACYQHPDQPTLDVTCHPPQVALPIYRADEVVGVLVLADQEVEALFDRRRPLLAILSRQIGVLLQAAWMFQQMARQQQDLIDSQTTTESNPAPRPPGPRSGPIARRRAVPERAN